MKAYLLLLRIAKRQCTIGRAMLALLFFVSSAVLAQSDAEPEDALARSIVEKADEVRFPKDGYEVNVSVDTKSADGTSEMRKYRVLSKGNQNAIILATEPASERGQIMLMKGHDLWIFLPAVSQPVRLSFAQRLTGQVSNGDLARANLGGDYSAKILRSEKMDGEATYVLELTAVDRSVSYNKVVYWVRQNGFRPHKAEFYSLSGRLLKTCLYQEYEPMAGRTRPSRLVMQDALHQDEVSVLEYHDMRAKEFPDRIFNKDYLKRLE